MGVDVRLPILESDIARQRERRNTFCYPEAGTGFAADSSRVESVSGGTGFTLPTTGVLKEAYCDEISKY